VRERKALYKKSCLGRGGGGQSFILDEYVRAVRAAKTPKRRRIFGGGRKERVFQCENLTMIYEQMGRKKRPNAIFRGG